MSVATNPSRGRRATPFLGQALIGGSLLAFQLAPAAGAVVGDDLLEHGGEGGRIERFALTHGDGAGSLIVVPGGDDALGIGHDRAVVHKDVDVVLRRQQGAKVAMQHELRTVSAVYGG